MMLMSPSPRPVRRVKVATDGRRPNRSYSGIDVMRSECVPGEGCECAPVTLQGAVKKLEITSTSRHSAICTDVVLREGGQVRLIFRPEMVENPSDPAACVRGRFLYQKKGRNERWEDRPATSHATIKKGEEYHLELHAGELRHLLREVAPLYRVFQRTGIPQGRQEFIAVGEQLAQFLELTESELNDFLASNRAHATLTLRRLLRWLSRNPSVAQQLADEELPELNVLVGLANLKAVLEIWRHNESNDGEEFWQKTLTKYGFVLSQLFAYPVVVIQGKAYVGGKKLDNKHGNLVDFLGRVSSSGAAVLIEIKTPVTQLISSEYRQDVFPPSRDLAGSIAQVLQYRESLMQEFHAVTHGEKGWLSSDPRCIVICGSATKQLTTDAQKRSFERFRERVIGVTIITYDELFARVEGLIKLLESSIPDNAA
jgi:hypothetical protein